MNALVQAPLPFAGSPTSGHTWLRTPGAPIPPSSVDWARVGQATYEVRQRYSYTYTRPVADLHQRLMLVPPDQHGDQTLLWHTLDVRGIAVPPGYRVTWETDAFGNYVCLVAAPAVEHEVAFEARYQVRRDRAQPGPRPFPKGLFLRPTPLTAPDAALRAVAREIRRQAVTPLARAEQAHAWASQALIYELGATQVHTPAAVALQGGRGVCQDYAHLLLSVLRLLGVPARYVSGHLLGEGVPHAWVEALVEGAVIAYDPTHHRRARLDYITVAVGRDFTDVSPTSGSFRGTARGELRSTKRADVLAVADGAAA